MDIQAVRMSLDILASAVAGTPTVPAKVALDTVDVARSAIAEVEKMQNEQRAFSDGAREQFAALEKAADAAIEQATVATNRLEYERKQVAKRRISKRAVGEMIAVEKACDQVREAIERSIPEIVATLLALRKRIVNQNGKNVWQSTKEAGHWTVKNMHGVTIAVCEARTEAMGLVLKMLNIEKAAEKKSTVTLEDLDLEKMGPSLTVDLDEDPNPGRSSPGGAPAEIADCGPQIHENDDE